MEYQIQKNANGIFLQSEGLNTQLLKSQVFVYWDEYSVGVAFLAASTDKVWILACDNGTGIPSKYPELVQRLDSKNHISSIRVQSEEPGLNYSEDPVYKILKSLKLHGTLSKPKKPVTPMHVIAEFDVLRRQGTAVNVSFFPGWQATQRQIEQGIQARDIPPVGYALALGLAEVAPKSYYQSAGYSRVYW